MDEDLTNVFSSISKKIGNSQKGLNDITSIISRTIGFEIDPKKVSLNSQNGVVRLALPPEGRQVLSIKKTRLIAEIKEKTTFPITDIKF